MIFFRAKPKPASSPEGPFFPWDARAYTVGVARFDAAHQGLANLLNRLHQSLTETRDRAKAQQILEQLIEATRAHFLDEEQALRDAGFPDLESHQAEHQLLLEEAAHLLYQFKGGAISGMALPGFLKHWMVGHMQDSDRKYAAHLRRNGVR